MTRKFTFRQALKGFETNPYWVGLDEADRSHLRRWSAHPSAEKIWQRLSNKLRVPAPDTLIAVMTVNDLIRVVLAIRRETDSLDRSAAADKKMKATERKARDAAMWALKRTAKAVTGPTSNPAIWRERARLLRRAADICMAQIPQPRTASRLPAIDRDGSRARQQFSSRLSQHLHLLAEEWCDLEVAVLTEIACPGKKVTIDMVRAARKKLS